MPSLIRSLCVLQQCAPTFGAIPSNKDLEQKKEQADDKADQLDEIMTKILEADALATLNSVEVDQPEKAQTVKKQLYRMWIQEQLKGGPVSNGRLKSMLAEQDNQVSRRRAPALKHAHRATDAHARSHTQSINSRGVALDRRRMVVDEDDSDVDLDGL